MTFRFLSPALIELTEAAEYYEEKVPGLGTEFIDEADAALALILNYPEAWTRVSENYRHCNFRKFPYTIIYARRSDKEILIISVFHQSREPLSWRRNL